MPELVVALLFAGAGVVLAAWASHAVVGSSTALATRLGLSPFVVGLTLVAIGTDLPEIANSVVASYRGQGDINVGDSYGSVFVQIALAFGLLPIVGAPLVLRRRLPALQLGISLVALGAGYWLLSDGDFGRLDAGLLIALFAAAMAVALRPSGEQHGAAAGGATARPIWRELLVIAAGFAGLIGGAALLVDGVLRGAAALDAPPLVVGFIGASIGTSAPELVIALTAARKGNAQLAAGDLLGASVADSTISVALGPLLFPTAVTATATHEAILVAGAGVSAALVVVLIGRHNRVSGAALIGLALAGLAFIAR
ncbi:MAG: hypothetical protein A2138_20150 [Deltaproteobacteria bacterium RBG_16_71_12]|nr:MAG: hypothetical protein A2138_20150 [Deltaproteobacteria bacterium RBG_16_71_12]